MNAIKRCYLPFLFANLRMHFVDELGPKRCDFLWVFIDFLPIFPVRTCGLDAPGGLL